MLPCSTNTSPQSYSSSKMATNDDILSYLNDMKAQANSNNEALRKDVNKKMNLLTEKIDTVKKDAMEKETRNDVKMKGIMQRLDSIEKKMYDNKNKCEENKEERKRQLDRTNAFKESFGLVDKPDDATKVKTWSELVDESRKVEEEKREKEKQKNMKHWTKKIYARERSKKSTEDENTDEKTKTDLEKEEEIKKKVSEEKEKDELRMNNTPLHEEADWSWDDSELEWDGTVERNEAQKKRKIERYRNKKILQLKVAKKAKHIIGLGPIRRASIGYFFDIIADFEEAKKMAIDEFLSEYLQLNEEERKYFVILETVIAKNDEDLIYVTFQDFESIKENKSRVAQIKNDEIKIRNFIPPQYWARYKFLSNYCSEERLKDSNIKTMIHFNDTDLEVLFKDKKVDEQYYTVSLKDIEKETGNIPNFDHSVSWIKRQDRPPKNPPRLVTEVVCPPSIRGSKPSKQISTSSSSSSGQSLPSKRKKTSHQSTNHMETEDNKTEVSSDKSL